MRRALRIAACGAVAALALVLLLAGGMLVAGNTAGGRRGIEDLTAHFTAGMVRIEGLGGSFPSHLTLDRLRLSDAKGVWLEVRGLRLDWHPLPLLRWRVRIDRLHAAQLSMERLPVLQSQGGGNSSLPDIAAGEVVVDRLHLGAPLAGAVTDLAVNGNLHLRTPQDLDLALAAVRQDGEGTYALQLLFNSTRMDGLLTLHEPAGGPLARLAGLPAGLVGELDGRVSLSGPRRGEAVDLKVDAGDMHAAALGTLDLTQESGDLTFAFTAPAMQPLASLGWHNLQLAGRWLGPLARSQTTAHLNAQGLQLPGAMALADLQAGVQATAGQLQLTATGSGLQLPPPRPDLLRVQPVTLAGSLRLDQPSRPFQLSASHPLFRLDASGQAQAGALSADATLVLNDIAPLAGDGLSGLKGGAALSVQAGQRKDGWTFDAALKGRNLVVPGMAGALTGPAPQAMLNAKLGAGVLQVAKLQATGAGVAVDLKGQLLLQPPPNKGKAPQALQLAGQVALTNLALLDPQLTGRLGFDGKVAGAFDDFELAGSLNGLLAPKGQVPGAITGHVQAKNLPRAPVGELGLQGLVEQSPLQLLVAAQRDKAGVATVQIRRGSWKSLQLSGDALVPADVRQAHGSLTARVARLQDLQHLLGMDLAGTVDLQAAVLPPAPAAAPGGRSGSAPQPRINLQITAHDIATPGFTGAGTLSANGPLERLQLALAVQSPALAGQPGALQADGVLDLPAGTLQLSGLTATLHGLELKQQGVAHLVVQPPFKLADLRLAAGGATLDVAGSVLPQLDLQLSLAGLTPQVVNVFAPGLLAHGSGSASAHLSGRPAAPDGHADLQLRGIRATGGNSDVLPALDADLALDLAGGHAQTHGEVRAGHNSKVAVEGLLPWPAGTPMALKLTGRIDAAELNPVLEARGRRITGILELDATVSGSAPDLGGTVTLSQGSLHDYKNGIDVTQLNGTLKGAGQQLQVQNLVARAGPGTISITGDIGVLQPGVPVDLKLTARDAQPLSSPLITGNVDADLTLKGSVLAAMELGGKVQVNRALINIPNSFPPNVAVLDVRRPGQAPPVAAAPGPVIRLAVEVQAPRQVLVRGRGLDAELGGHIQVGGTVDAAQFSGGFTLQRGLFTLGSSRLNFTEGRVGFAGRGVQGGGIDPSLDFTAETQAADATARVRITGFADAPRFELTSVPQMPQDEILARLLFGQSASQLTALQAAQIGAALTTLSGVVGGGLNPLVALQKKLGLDRLTVGSADTSQPGSTQNPGTTIEAGRYVTDRIFVDLKQNTNGATQLQVDVDLTRHLKVQTRVGTGTAPAQGTTPDNDPGSSLGLSYRFEY